MVCLTVALACYVAVVAVRVVDVIRVGVHSEEGPEIRPVWHGVANGGVRRGVSKGVEDGRRPPQKQL
jgi:hypothetical protein